MTDRDRLTITLAPAEGLFALELWGDAAAVQARLAMALPSPCRSAPMAADRVMWWEPCLWLVRTPALDRASALGRLGGAIEGHGAVTDVSSGFSRIRLEGTAWRELLMIGAVFDAESPTFAPGSVAGTVIHHLPLRLDVIDDWTVDAYTPPSYTPDLIQHWSRTAARWA